MSDRDELGKTQPSVPTRGVKVEGGREPLPEQHAGRYVIPEGVTDPELGRGGMGRVITVHDTHLRRDVAIKELHTEHTAERSSSGAMLENLFLREARVLARLEHPGVVPVYELGRRGDGAPYYAMRKIRGQSLHAAEAQCANFDERLALLSHFIAVVQTVGFAHSRGVIHRDLKPENVMVSRFGETQVIDWGLALVKGEALEGGITAGTPLYMAPEVVSGTSVDARSDVWALGVMLYELLSGKLPFEGDRAALAQAILDKVPTPLRLLEPKAPRGLIEVAERALQKDPSKRYVDAGAMADALEAAQRARAPRPVALQSTVAVLAFAVGGLGVFALKTSNAAEHTVTRAQYAVADAHRAEADADADAALRALRAGDTLTAQRFAARAPEHPLARGVAWLAAEKGVPEQSFTQKLNAGCASLLVTGDSIVCPSFGGVLIFGVDGAQRAELKTGPRGWQHAAVAVGDELITGGDDRLIHHWSLKTGKQTSEQAGFSAPIRSLAIDGDSLIVGLGDGVVMRVEKNGKSEELTRHARPVTQVSAAGGRVASVSEGLMRITGEGAVELERHVGAIQILDAQRFFAGVERSLATFTDDHPTSVGDGHRDEVTALITVGDRLISGSADGTVRWWFIDGSSEGVLEGFAPGVQALAGLPDGRIAVLTTDKRLEVWVLPERLKAPDEAGVPSVQAWWPGEALISGSRDGHVRRFDTKTQAVLEMEAHHTGWVRGLARVPGDTDPEALRFLSGGDDGRVLTQRWNGEVEVLDTILSSRVLNVSVSNDGQLAAWAADDGTLVVWNLTLKKEVLRRRDTVVLAMTFSPDARTLLLGREDKHLVLLDMSSLLDRVLEPLDGAITSVAFAADGKTFAAGARDGQVVLFNASTVERIAARAERSGRVGALAFSHDSKWVLAGRDDGSAQLYAASPFALAADIPTDSGDVNLVAFDGDALIIAGTDRRLHHLTPQVDARGEGP